MVFFEALFVFLGGALIRVLKLGARGMAVQLVILTLASGVFALAILADCPEVRLAGLNVPYPDDT